VAAANWLVAALCDRLGAGAPPAQDVLRQFADGAPIQRTAIAVCAIFVMPAVEEWIFRERLQSWLLRRISPFRGIVLVAIVFSSLHFSLRAFLPLAILSGGLSLARLRTGRLLPSIVMHALYNASSLAFLCALGPSALAS
jgi:membrane protease YdiL (CAAX protease family)